MPDNEADAIEPCFPYFELCHRLADTNMDWRPTDSPWKCTQGELVLAADRAAARNRTLRRVQSAPSNGGRDSRREAPEFEVSAMLTVKEARFARRPASATVKSGPVGGAGPVRQKNKARADDGLHGPGKPSQIFCGPDYHQSLQQGPSSKDVRKVGMQHSLYHASVAQNKSLRTKSCAKGPSQGPTSSSASRSHANTKRFLARSRQQNMTARSNGKSLVTRPARHIRVHESEVKTSLRPRPSTPVPSTAGPICRGELPHKSPYSVTAGPSRTNQNHAPTNEQKKSVISDSKADSAAPQSVQDEEKIDKLMFTPVNLWVKSTRERIESAKNNSAGDEDVHQMLKSNMPRQAVGPLHDSCELERMGRANALKVEEVPDTTIDAGAVNDLTMNLKFESNPQETVSADSLMSNNSTIFEDLCLKSAQLADVMGVTNCWLANELLDDAHQHLLLMDVPEPASIVVCQ